MGKLFLITAPSGSGKTFLATKLIADETWIEGVSHTSRPMRIGEIANKTYYFKSKEEMEQMIKRDEFIEFVEYDRNLYGMSKEEIERGLANNRPMFIIVEHNGFLQIKEQYPESIGIFLHMKKEDCMANMLLRGDSIENANKRIARYDREISDRVDFDYVVRNVRGKENESANVLRAIVKQYMPSNTLHIGEWYQPNTIYRGNPILDTQITCQTPIYSGEGDLKALHIDKKA